MVEKKTRLYLRSINVFSRSSVFIFSQAKLLNCSQILGHVADQNYVAFIRGFHKVAEIGNNGNIGIRKTVKTKKYKKVLRENARGVPPAL